MFCFIIIYYGARSISFASFSYFLVNCFNQLKIDFATVLLLIVSERRGAHRGCREDTGVGDPGGSCGLQLAPQMCGHCPAWGGGLRAAVDVSVPLKEKGFPCPPVPCLCCHDTTCFENLYYIIYLIALFPISF